MFFKVLQAQSNATVPDGHADHHLRPAALPLTAGGATCYVVPLRGVVALDAGSEASPSSSLLRAPSPPYASSCQVRADAWSWRPLLLAWQLDAYGGDGALSRLEEEEASEPASGATPQGAPLNKWLHLQLISKILDFKSMLTGKYKIH